MKYFDFIGNKNDIFYKAPMEFSKFSSRDILSRSLGATLYMSGLRKNLINDIKSITACSTVICLEDAISTSRFDEAELNVMEFFKSMDYICTQNPDFLNKIPLIFLRVRCYEQFENFLQKSSLTGLCGFIFPKFNAIEGERYFSTLRQYNSQNNCLLYGMPILETREVIYKMHRIENLIKIKAILDKYWEIVLNIRIGGTDFSGIYGLRRSRDHVIYDLQVINDCIGDIINIFKIDDYVISAPVNEYFNFASLEETNCLVRETILDRVNGLIGKTVIHPRQVNIVNALFAVTKEDYLDAKSILTSSSDGVIKSIYSNKMNEVRPHLKWAHDVMLLSKIMGVLNNGKDYTDLLGFGNSNLYRSKYENIIKY